MAPAAEAATVDGMTPSKATAASAAAAAIDPLTWRITSEHLDPTLPQSRKVHLVVLNWHLPALTARLWQLASTRLCADGGANRLHDEIPSLAAAAGIQSSGPDAARAAFLPDLIKGDLDSVRADVRAYYTSRGVAMVDLSADQDTTDLTKCLAYLDEVIRGANGGANSGANGGVNGSCGENGGTDCAEARSSGSGRGGGGSDGSSGSSSAAADAQAMARRLRDEHAIVVLGALGGRLDHILAHLNTLYSFPQLDITLCGDGNLVRLLPAGRCVVAPHPAMEGPTCGLVPLTGPAVGSSRGLKWDLDNTELRFRGLISTSNIIEGSEVDVTANEDLIWITEFREDTRGTPSGSGGGTGSGTGHGEPISSSGAYA